MDSQKISLTAAISCVLMEFQRCGVPVAPCDAVVAATIEGFESMGVDEVFQKFETGVNGLVKEVECEVESLSFIHPHEDLGFLGRGPNEYCVTLGSGGTHLALTGAYQLPDNLAPHFLKPSRRIALAILSRKLEYGKRARKLTKLLDDEYREINKASPLWVGAGD